MTGEGSKTAKIDVVKKIKIILLVLEAELATEAMCSVLLSDVSHGDTAFSMSRAVMLVPALQGRLDLLFKATGDRLHQRYRIDFVPESAGVLRALREVERLTVAFGMGPLMLVFDKLDQRMWDLLAARGLRLTTAGIGNGAYLIEKSRRSGGTVR